MTSLAPRSLHLQQHLPRLFSYLPWLPRLPLLPLQGLAATRPPSESLCHLPSPPSSPRPPQTPQLSAPSPRQPAVRWRPPSSWADSPLSAPPDAQLPRQPSACLLPAWPAQAPLRRAARLEQS